MPGSKYLVPGTWYQYASITLRTVGSRQDDVAGLASEKWTMGRQFGIELHAT